VTVSDAGQPAHTVFRLHNAWPDSEPPMSLLEAELKTGRTHQIRVHLAHIGFPILGDEKYGDFTLNKKLHKNQILMRMFLHASEISFSHPESGEPVHLHAPLPRELTLPMEKLNRDHAHAV
jgi:23S rRNA pseudouridine955/2504/2580 synthase